MQGPLSPQSTMHANMNPAALMENLEVEPTITPPHSRPAAIDLYDLDQVMHQSKLFLPCIVAGGVSLIHIYVIGVV